MRGLAAAAHQRDLLKLSEAIRPYEEKIARYCR